MNYWLELLAGCVLLYFGAEWLVGGASSLALSLRVAPLLVGLTVVAYGTSAPEVMVGIQAAAAGHGALALGNVIGSNAANIGLVLGLVFLVRPARASKTLRRRELPVLIGTTLLLPFLLVNGRVSMWEAGTLAVGAVAYTVTMIMEALSSSSQRAAARRDAAIQSEAGDTTGAPKGKNPVTSGMVALIGLLVLLLGGQVFVGGAVDAALALHVSERVIGLTVVAVGTSLPELIASIVASLRGHADIAVGNVIGSNIFNVLLSLGAAGLTGNLVLRLSDVALEIVLLVIMTVLAAVSLRKDRRVSRLEGGIFLGLYCVFSALAVAV